MRARKMFLLTALLAVCRGAFAAGPVVDCVEVKTPAKENAQVKVWYRVPRSYVADGKELSRVLVLFGGRNCDGRPEVSGKLGWPEWADLNGIFLVAPTLRNDDYWEPAGWSGRALLNALAQIGAKYRIATSGLLYYGYSAGSQASNLFPAWRPDLCRAYVSHACGVFHAPSARMKGVAGLVTCGDADAARYVLSRDFVGGCRRLGVPVVWKSFPNHPHDVPPGSVRLAKEFLAHYHWAHLEDLGRAPLRTKAAAFVGDDADGFYYEAGSSAAADVLEEDRVDLPSEVVASAWGASRRPEPRREAEPAVSVDRFGGVEVVSVVPAGVREDARVLVLFGGRGSSGEQAVRELGFMPWAVERGWCILAPSFSEGEYWRPESGSADVVASAVAALRRRHGLRPLPVFLFGYSAGGQLAALLQDRAPARVSAWGVYGCGVYPDVPVGSSPAYVACGMDDADRLRISRDFAYRYREAGGPLLWKPVAAAHELNAQALELARAFFAAVSSDGGCASWGEDDTWRVLPRERIDEEFRNPLYDYRVRTLWQRR